MKSRKYTKEEFIEAVSTSRSIGQVLSKLKLYIGGGNYKSIHNRIKDFNLDTSHFKGQGWLKGGTHDFTEKPLEDYLSNKRYIKSHSLRLRLLKEGIFDNKCYSCGLTTWLDNSIPLELHHINGDHSDNTLSNLTILCPNCHALTDSYRGKNKVKK